MAGVWLSSSSWPSTSSVFCHANSHHSVHDNYIRALNYLWRAVRAPGTQSSLTTKANNLSLSCLTLFNEILLDVTWFRLEGVQITIVQLRTPKEMSGWQWESVDRWWKTAEPISTPSPYFSQFTFLDPLRLSKLVQVFYPTLHMQCNKHML